jgi:hypothetical protein
MVEVDLDDGILSAARVSQQEKEEEDETLLPA